MSIKSPGQTLLENAYLLESPADNLAYYRRLAASYDTDFARDLGWAYPRAIADAYRAAATPADVPVADIGCGTGCVAAELGLPPDQIEGLDISPEMLAIAAGKALYHALHQVDLTGPLARFANRFGAVVSAGTFTYGHLGPAALAGLLAIARPGALFLIGVNAGHFAAQNYPQTLQTLVADAQITAATLTPIRIYTTPGHAHSNDQALILQFRKR